MWENTRQGVEELARERVREREEMQQQRRQHAEEQAEQAKEQEKQRWEEERERERLKRKRKREVDEEWWESVLGYVAAWREEGKEIPWPPCFAEDGDGVRFGVENIRQFLWREARVLGVGFEQVVKVERVRWHPDKICQRFGDGLDDERMGRVLEVWRAVDEVWRGIRE